MQSDNSLLLKSEKVCIMRLEKVTGSLETVVHVLFVIYVFFPLFFLVSTRFLSLFFVLFLYVVAPKIVSLGLGKGLVWPCMLKQDAYPVCLYVTNWEWEFFQHLTPNLSHYYLALLCQHKWWRTLCGFDQTVEFNSTRNRLHIQCKS